MCAVIGALVWRLISDDRVDKANKILKTIEDRSAERGRDGYGFNFRYNAVNEVIFNPVRPFTEEYKSLEDRSIKSNACFPKCHTGVFIENIRAEPTTEYVKHKKLGDQQPYQSGKWAIVHNGTIANDKELRTHEVPTQIDSAAIAEVLGDSPPNFNSFTDAIKQLKGSYAILAYHIDEPETIYCACNYRPIWYCKTDVGVFFASSEEYFPSNLTPCLLPPYTMKKFQHWASQLVTSQLDLLEDRNQKALVVCSGGLDSVIAATYTQRVLGYDIELLHFTYGCRAEDKEVEAVKAVAEELRVPCRIVPLPVYKQRDSPLFDKDSKVAGGEAGAEFAYEWVPARNLLLLSVASAIAEANGFETLVLGNNLEEAGAYPDNEPEFIRQFNKILPFAVGDGKQLQVIMPIGNFMKHEIVKLGDNIGAPMHLTWSCYRHGEIHCGSCGPCFMRRTAFEINDIPEVIEYQTGDNDALSKEIS